MGDTQRITITVCGDGGTGKSSMTLRLVRSQWTHEYDPTIEDQYSVTRNVDGQNYQLMLTDTAGQEEYRALWGASSLRSDAFLLVYDITNPDSLDALEYFTDLIEIEAERRHDAGDELPPVMIVAGNKCDLQGQRQVRSQQGLEWARKHKCGFMETSAREMVNIEETFALLVRRVVESRRMKATGGKAPAWQAQPPVPMSSLSLYEKHEKMRPEKPKSRGNTTDRMDYSRAGASGGIGGGEKRRQPRGWWARTFCCSCKRVPSTKQYESDIDEKAFAQEQFYKKQLAYYRRQQRGWFARTFFCSCKEVPSTKMRPMHHQQYTRQGDYRYAAIEREKRRRRHGWFARTFLCSCKKVPSTKMGTRSPGGRYTTVGHQRQRGWFTRTFCCSCKRVPSTKMRMGDMSEMGTHQYEQRGWFTRTFCCSCKRVPSTKILAEGESERQHRNWCARTFLCSCKKVPSTKIKPQSDGAGSPADRAWFARTFCCSCKRVPSTKIKSDASGQNGEDESRGWCARTFLCSCKKVEDY